MTKINKTIEFASLDDLIGKEVYHPVDKITAVVKSWFWLTHETAALTCEITSGDGVGDWFDITEDSYWMCPSLDNVMVRDLLQCAAFMRNWNFNSITENYFLSPLGYVLRVDYFHWNQGDLIAHLAHTGAYWKELPMFTAVHYRFSTTPFIQGFDEYEGVTEKLVNLATRFRVYPKRLVDAALMPLHIPQSDL